MLTDASGCVGAVEIWGRVLPSAAVEIWGRVAPVRGQRLSEGHVAPERRQD